MNDVRENGLTAARHLQGDIYEVRAGADRVIYRILFATEGRFSQILLALEGFKKKTQKTPLATTRLAEDRLAKWRARGAAAKKARRGSGCATDARPGPAQPYTSRAISLMR